MSIFEAITLCVLFLSAGGFGLGYTFLKLDAQVKLNGRRRALGDEEIDALKKEIDSLRAQIADVKETSVAFDLSLEETLHQLERRLGEKATTDLPQRLSN